MPGEPGGGAEHSVPAPRGIEGEWQAPATLAMRGRAERTRALSTLQEPFPLSIHLPLDFASISVSVEGKMNAQKGGVILPRLPSLLIFSDMNGKSFFICLLTLLTGSFCHVGVLNFSAVEFTALSFYGPQKTSSL